VYLLTFVLDPIVRSRLLKTDNHNRYTVIDFEGPRIIDAERSVLT